MGVRKYTSEVVNEGRRVRWPKREQILPVFGVVLLICAIAGILLLLFDIGALNLLEMLKDSFESLGSGGEPAAASAMLRMLI